MYTVTATAAMVQPPTKGARANAAPPSHHPCPLALPLPAGSHNAKSVANTLRLYLQFEWLFKVGSFLQHICSSAAT